MDYPKVEHVQTEHDDYLELHGADGTYRVVIFRSAAAAGSAMALGRAEIDCVAVGRGFLPPGRHWGFGPGFPRR